jgi:chemotaxis protein methyltransferase CheR
LNALKQRPEGSHDGVASLGRREFEEIRAFLLARAGIQLNDHKVSMVESRLAKRLSANGVDTFRDYVAVLLASDAEQTEAVNALTTNKTEFLREAAHFEHLTRDFLPRYLERTRRDRLFFWSAAASTGQEAYTLAIILHQFLAPRGVEFRIYASDIDTNVLAQAERGIYSEDQIRPFPTEVRARYLQRGRGSNAGCVRVCDELRGLIKFRKMNLVADEPPLGLHFDAVFLRNVLIYFGSDTIQTVVAKMHRSLNPGGLLFVGHSESLNGIKHGFEAAGTSIYKKPNG